MESLLQYYDTKKSETLEFRTQLEEQNVQLFCVIANRSIIIVAYPI